MTLCVQQFSTPEAAFQERKAAYAAKDIERFLGTMSFRQEALELLQETAQDGSPPDETTIASLAAQYREELRAKLMARGFIGTDWATCEIVEKFQEGKDVARLVLSCTGPRHSIAFSARVVRLREGWRFVRGRQLSGSPSAPP